MAIDTAAKRRSSAASRRMPWMRRIGIAPDGSVDQADRQGGTWVYSGILSAVPSTPEPPAGKHFRLPVYRPECRLAVNRPEFRVPA